MRIFKSTLVAATVFVLNPFCLFSQNNNTNGTMSASVNNLGSSTTFTNPVLPGDHPDPCLLKVGDDFYTTGSSFHVTPCLEILHSKDLVNWKVISRVAAPDWEHQTSKPGSGGWGGTIAYFYGKYWAYFGLNTPTIGFTQVVSSADSPEGPWSELKLIPGTGNDNSIFVDDDGTPYTVCKNFGFWKLGRDGLPIGKPTVMDWLPGDHKDNGICEGPTIFKRNGYYYWTAATNAWGHEIVYKSNYNTMPLRNGKENWTRLGNFSEEYKSEFFAPNHHSITVQINDGTWWVLTHSVTKDWGGLGRAGMLSQVLWNGDIPKAIDPVPTPLTAPNLPSNGYGKRLPISDNFSTNTLHLFWSFFGKTSPTKWSLTERAGWVRLKPDTIRMMLLQRMAEKSYFISTKVEFTPTSPSTEAGLIQVNGAEDQHLKLVSTYDSGEKIKLIYNGTTIASVANTIGKSIWLKLENNNNIAKGYYGTDGVTWTDIGKQVDTKSLNQSFSGWIGNYQGLYAQGAPADFDVYLYNLNKPQALYANFNSSTPKIIKGDTVTYTDKSTDNPTSWLWTFEGGTPASSSEQNPSVRYDSIGYYKVSLIASNANGSDSITKNNYTSVSSTLPLVALTDWLPGTTNDKQIGINRLMTVFVMAESSTDFTATAVTYGGQTMTKQTEKLQIDGSRLYVAIFTLNEAGVNAASSGTITVTWSKTPSDGYSVYSAMLGYVDQTTPVIATATNGLTGTTITTSALTADSGNMVLLCGATANNNKVTFNNGFISKFESNASWGDGIGGSKMGSGVNETPSFTQSASGRMALCAIVVKNASTKPTISVDAKPIAGGTVTGGGTFDQNQIVTITASAANGYKFDNWTEGYTVISTDPDYKFSVSGSKLLTANFSKLTNIQNVSDNECRIYPNPASSILNVDFSDIKIGREIKVYNSLGQLAYNSKAEKSNIQLDIRSLNLFGLVNVQIIDGVYIYNHKILLK